MSVKIAQHRDFAATVKKPFSLISRISIDMHKEVTKRGVVCFSKGRLDLEKINKINFRGPRLEKQKKFEAKKGGLKTSLART